MGLETASASEDVIGDLPSPRATINLQKFAIIQNKWGRRKWEHQPCRLFPFICPGYIKDYGGKRWIF